jgi:hypothetical protein
MSAPQGNSACPITVDRPTADVCRLEAKKVLMFNHEPFEDYLDYLPCRQLALANIYRDATAAIDALGWDEWAGRGWVRVRPLGGGLSAWLLGAGARFWSCAWPSWRPWA